ncbi:MAG: hypothetical protein Fur002_10110 [Anaerolineales bacterium]
MANWIRNLFSLPLFGDEKKTRAAMFLIRFSWAALFLLSALIFQRVFILKVGANPTVIVFCAMLFVFWGVWRLAHRGYVYFSGAFLIVSVWMLLTILAYAADGLRDLSLVAYIILIILASLLLDWRFALATTAASLVVIGYFAAQEYSGARPAQYSSAWNYARDLMVVLSLAAILVYLLGRDWRLSLRAAQIELQERLRAEEKFQRQARYLSALNQTALGLLNSSELRPLLETILARACDLLHTQHGAIEIILPDSSAMRQEVGVGLMKFYNDTLTLKNEGLTGTIWARNETIVVNDYPSWQNSLPEFVTAGLRAALGVPLRVEDEVIGVVVVSVTQQARAFTPEEIDLMERFAALAALAIHNTRLYEQMQRELAERKTAEAALRESDERMRVILASIPDMIFEMSQDGLFLDMLAAAEVKPLFPPSFFIGKNVKDVMPAPVAEQTLFALRRAVETRQMHAFEYELLESSGSRFYEARLSAISSSSAMVMVRDITQRKFVQSEREKLINELEEKNSELERFTYTVSHDLKSPLITIKGFLGFLEKSAASGNVARLQGDIARIAEAADKMQTLLNDLLNLSRIGRISEPPQRIDVAELTREVAELLHGRLHEKPFEVSIGQNLPPVYGDRRRLFEVFQNLIDNAAKFIGDAERPRIEIGHQGFENDMPVFYVRDNGIGIAAEHRERVFGLFNKLDAQSEGTGIGLALVKRIIEVHKGRIWVESEEGRGATFFFTLPQSPSN